MIIRTRFGRRRRRKTKSNFVSKINKNLSINCLCLRLLLKSSTPKFTFIHTHPPRALIKCRIRVATERKINRHLKTSINTALFQRICFVFFFSFFKCLFYFFLSCNLAMECAMFYFNSQLFFFLLLFDCLFGAWCVIPLFSFDLRYSSHQFLVNAFLIGNKFLFYFTQDGREANTEHKTQKKYNTRKWTEKIFMCSQITTHTREKSNWTVV